MIIPKKIKIGETNYNIKFKRVVDWTNKKVTGEINYGEGIMKIKNHKQGDKFKEDIFFHEMAHGVLKELEFNHPKISKFRCDELFVQEMGLTLRKTFLDLLKSQKGNETV